MSEAALERCIAVARRAVGDSGRRHRVIQTVHGRGYRFVAPVEERLDHAAGDCPTSHAASPDLPEASPPPLPAGGVTCRVRSPAARVSLATAHRAATPAPAPADRGTPAGHGAVWHAGAHHGAGRPAGLGGVPAPGADVPHPGPGVCAAV